MAHGDVIGGRSSPDDATRPLTLAFYLPQFSPLPENDAWWGRGFTEWTKVVTAQPQFLGHYQPHIPGDLGFYDLRLPEVREHQAALARRYGIDGFCYYHYWFKGRRVLERVFDEVLESGRPDFPFCLLWANENWTRAWDGGDRSILVEQEYDAEDDRRHLEFLQRAFADPRYIRLDGRPLLGVYRVQSMPAPRETFAMWRRECERAGLGDPFIVKFDTWTDFDDPGIYGCDAAADFPPHGCDGPRVHPRSARPQHRYISYAGAADFYSSAPDPPWIRYPTVFPGWDNTPRRSDADATVFVGNSVQEFERWLTQAAVERTKRLDAPPVLFLNAWNEWAEGAHLEPDINSGRSYLEALLRVIGPVRPSGTADPAGLPQAPPPATFARLYLDLYEDHVALERRHAAFAASFERRLADATAERERQLEEMTAKAQVLAERLAELRERSGADSAARSRD